MKFGKIVEIYEKDVEFLPKGFKKRTCEQDGVWNEPMFEEEYWNEHDRRRSREERDEKTR